MPAIQRHTVDASVLLSAFNPMEAAHAESSQFLSALRAAATPVVVPALIFPEVAATISRALGDPTLALSFAEALRNLPNLLVVALDDVLSRLAEDTAARYRLRGSDAVYVAVALRYGCSLVTLDREQQIRAPASVQARTPGDALAQT